MRMEAVMYIHRSDTCKLIRSYSIINIFVSFKAACNILRGWLVYFAVPFWIIQKLMYESCVLFTEACVCLKGNIEEHQLVCIESGAFTLV